MLKIMIKSGSKSKEMIPLSTQRRWSRWKQMLGQTKSTNIRSMGRMGSGQSGSDGNSNKGKILKLSDVGSEKLSRRTIRLFQNQFQKDKKQIGDMISLSQDIMRIEKNNENLKDNFFNKTVRVPPSQFGTKRQYFKNQWVCKKLTSQVNFHETMYEARQMKPDQDKNGFLSCTRTRFNTKKPRKAPEKFRLNSKSRRRKSKISTSRLSRVKTLPNFRRRKTTTFKKPTEHSIKKRSDSIRFDNFRAKVLQTNSSAGIGSKLFPKNSNLATGREPKQKFNMRDLESRLFPGIFLSQRNVIDMGVSHTTPQFYFFLGYIKYRSSEFGKEKIEICQKLEWPVYEKKRLQKDYSGS